MLINEVTPHQYCFVFIWHITVLNTFKTVGCSIQPKQRGRRCIDVFFSAVCQVQMKAVSQGHTVTPRTSRSGFVILTAEHMASPKITQSVVHHALLTQPTLRISPRQADTKRRLTLEIIHSAPWMGPARTGTAAHCCEVQSPQFLPLAGTTWYWSDLHGLGKIEVELLSS